MRMGLQKASAVADAGTIVSGVASEGRRLGPRVHNGTITTIGVDDRWGTVVSATFITAEAQAV
jgi:hypothetical protein